MDTIKTAEVATEGGHWYAHSGEQVVTVPGARRQPVSPDLRHARKLLLLPGVTTVCRIQSAPGLVRYQVDQALTSALTLPRREGESLDDFKRRALLDSKEHAKQAAERGTDLHTALERFSQCKPFDSQWSEHVAVTVAALATYGIDLTRGSAEKSFAHPLGFGGKTDWHGNGYLLDYKSKDRIEDKRLAYDDHIKQLAACRRGLRLPPATKLLSVFVGIQDRAVHVHEWSAEDEQRGWEMFRACLTLWQLANRYDSSFTNMEEAA